MTKLDLTRLTLGKFGTNYPVCQLAAVAMNILRLIGQRDLLGPDAPDAPGGQAERASHG